MTIKKLNNIELDKLADTSAYTVTGAGGDLKEWVNGLTELLKENKIGTPKEFMTFTGKQMNDVFGLVGTKRYKVRLTFLAFPLDGLDVGKLAMFKLRMNDHWFDDICANNAQ